jgi:S-(hydroxymethyl)glutathione dehydrogenase / alcohol dehydrogenase
MKFQAAILHRPKAPMTIETVELGELQPGDALVKIRAAGLCHTDLEVIEGQLHYPMPIVLGHEAAGTVERVGAGVAGLMPGDAVVLSWNPHCGHCYYCEQDQPILCESYLRLGPLGVQFDGTTRLALAGGGGQRVHHLMFMGAFAEYCVVPAECAVKVPAAIPFDRACLIGCGVMTGVGAATRVARVGWGASAVVIGCGAVGLSAVQGARLAGAGRIIAVDVDVRKLALARRLGATDAVDATAARGADALAAIRELTHGRGADYVFEAAGNAAAFRLSAEAVRPGGQIVWLGKVNVNDDVAFRWGALMGEKRIVRSSYGGARPRRDFPLLAAAYLDGRLSLDELVSRRIALAEINDGFAALKRGDVVRAVVTFDG